MTTRQQTDFERQLQLATRPAYSVAYQLTRDRDMADDLVQEATLRALSAFGRLTPGAHFTAWFVRIVTNLFLNQRRRAHYAPDLLPSVEVLEAMFRPETDTLRLHQPRREPLSHICQQEDALRISEAFDALPGRVKTVCDLYFRREYTYQEIATTLACPIGTVRSQIHRGRSLLQKSLRAAECDRGAVSF